MIVPGGSKMPQQRLIVPDCSVMLPAFFPERLLIGNSDLDLSTRARPLEAAIRRRAVRAVAPDVLLAEFLKIAWSRAVDRSGGTTVSREEATRQILRFLQLPITAAAAADLSATALDLVASEGIAPFDSWYVACALQSRGEFWVSHRHADGLVERATASGVDVHVLSEESFR